MDTDLIMMDMDWGRTTEQVPSEHSQQTTVALPDAASGGNEPQLIQHTDTTSLIPTDPGAPDEASQYTTMVSPEADNQEAPSEGLHHDVSIYPDANNQIIIFEGPKEDNLMSLDANNQEVSSEAPQQASTESCGGSTGTIFQEDESSISSPSSSDTEHRQGPRPGTPSSDGEKVEEAQDGFSNLWTEREEHVITKPLDYVMGLPGKNFRGQVLSAFNEWLQIDSGSLEVIDRAVAMLHNASLLIDDIQDGSELRRGFPAAHCVFGTAQSINSANYAYFLAQQELLKLNKSSHVMQIFIEELLNLHRGQGIELFWRDTLTVPTEEEYLLMVSNKTGGLFRLAARLMQAVSSTDHNILPLAELVGVIFQIRDDHHNLSSEQMASAKGFCEDLTEGKFSLPVIHSIRASPTCNNEILNILKLRTTNADLKSHALWYMRTQTNSLEYTEDRLDHYRSIAQAMLEGTGVRNEQMEKVLEKLRLD